MKRDGAQSGAIALLRSQSELMSRQFAEDLAVSEPAEQQLKAPSAFAAKPSPCYPLLLCWLEGAVPAREKLPAALHK